MYSFITIIILSALTASVIASQDAPISQSDSNRIARIAAAIYSRTNQTIIAQYNSPEWPDSVIKGQDANPKLLPLLLCRLPKYAKDFNTFTNEISEGLISASEMYDACDYRFLQNILDASAALTKKLSLAVPQHPLYAALENAFSLFFLAMADCPACPPELINFTPACIVLHTITLPPITPLETIGAAEPLYISDSDSDSDRESTGSSATYIPSEPPTPSHGPSQKPHFASPPTSERPALPVVTGDTHHED